MQLITDSIKSSEITEGNCIDKDLIVIDKDEEGYILLILLENFQNIIATHGYDSSEKLVQEILVIINTMLPTNAVIYKIHTERFIIKFPAFTEKDIYPWVFEFQKKVPPKINIDKINMHVFLCIGAVAYPRYGKDIKELLVNAHINCELNSGLCKEYENHKCNEDFFVFNSTEKELYKQRIKLFNKLALAVSNNFEGFEVYYQPQICAKTCKCISAEALLRWRDSDGELVMSGVLIPALESLNLISEVGTWVMEQSVMQCREWISLGAPADFSISVNLSSTQIVKGLAEQILDILEKNNLSPNCLTIELTETTYMDEMQRGIDLFGQIRGYGIAVSIDDFGTGLSSLSYISKLPIDEVKIDSSFIWNMELDDASKKVIETVTAIAHSLGLKVCAEGVEKKSQLKILIELGVDLFQGFLYSKPLPAMEFEKLCFKQRLLINGQK